MLKQILILTLTLMVLNACTSVSTQKPSPLYSQTVLDRNEQLNNLKHWKIIGRIAFIQTGKRESAAINWQYNSETRNQQLDLTSYLGINVLHLSSQNNVHLLKIDGKTYQDDDLDSLITQLTGITLPTEALTYWLKALPYNETDIIDYDVTSKLPQSLTSQYRQRTWHINYSNYKNFHQFQLPTKLTISQGDLMIKIAISKWVL